MVQGLVGVDLLQPCHPSTFFRITFPTMDLTLLPSLSILPIYLLCRVYGYHGPNVFLFISLLSVLPS